MNEHEQGAPARAQPPPRAWYRSPYLRRLLIVLPWALLWAVSFPRILTAVLGDPASVGIEDLDREIDPKATIAQACRHSVIRVEHLDDAGTGPDARYQRWTVVPVQGHVDRVLLDTRTGKVICP